MVLFLCNLHHLQKDSGKHIVELDFGLGLQQHMEALYLFISPLVIAGLAVLLLSIFGSGKEILLVRMLPLLSKMDLIIGLFLCYLVKQFHKFSM